MLWEGAKRRGIAGSFGQPGSAGSTRGHMGWHSQHRSTGGNSREAMGLQTMLPLTTGTAEPGLDVSLHPTNLLRLPALKTGSAHASSLLSAPRECCDLSTAHRALAHTGTAPCLLKQREEALGRGLSTCPVGGTQPRDTARSGAKAAALPLRVFSPSALCSGSPAGSFALLQPAKHRGIAASAEVPPADTPPPNLIL